MHEFEMGDSSNRTKENKSLKRAKYISSPTHHHHPATTIVCNTTFFIYFKPAFVSFRFEAFFINNVLHHHISIDLAYGILIDNNGTLERKRGNSQSINNLSYTNKIRFKWLSHNFSVKFESQSPTLMIN